jgi:SPP1 family predicted phage head-tail adaptor
MIKICTSDLNRKVSLEKPVEIDNGAGGVTTVWVKVFDTWAKMRPGSGSETTRWGQLSATTMETITIRYCKELTEKWRIRFEDRYFNIRDVADLEEAHRFLEIACEEGVAQ